MPVAPADRVALLLEELRAADPAPARDPRQPGAAAGRLRVPHRPPEGGDGHARRADRARGAAGWPRPSTATTPARTAALREREFGQLYADHDRLLAERGALDTGDLVLRAFALLHERPHVRSRVAGRPGRRAGRRLPGRQLRPGRAAGAAVRGGARGHRGRRRGGAGRRFARPRRTSPSSPAPSPTPRPCTWSASHALPAGDRSPRPRGGRRTADPTPDAREGGQGALLALRLGARPGAGRSRPTPPRLIAGGTDPRSDRRADALGGRATGPVVCAALEERALPFRLHGSAAYFQRAEVRDLLAWLRLLADPADSGAAVRVMARPPVGLHSVDIARLTQLARRRKLDMPSAVAAALEGPQLTPEGRDRAQFFLRLYRPACAAFEDRRPDALRAAADRARGHTPPAGVRHPGRHRGAPAQHRRAARAGHRVHAPRARTPPRATSPATCVRLPTRALDWEEVPAPEHEQRGAGAGHRTPRAGASSTTCSWPG